MNIKFELSVKLQHPANEKQIKSWIRDRLAEPGANPLPKDHPLKDDKLQALRRSIKITDIKA